MHAARFALCAECRSVECRKRLEGGAYGEREGRGTSKGRKAAGGGNKEATTPRQLFKPGAFLVYVRILCLVIQGGVAQIFVHW